MPFALVVAHLCIFFSRKLYPVHMKNECILPGVKNSILRKNCASFSNCAGKRYVGYREKKLFKMLPFVRGLPMRMIKHGSRVAIHENISRGKTMIHYRLGEKLGHNLRQVLGWSIEKKFAITSWNVQIKLKSTPKFLNQQKTAGCWLLFLASQHDLMWFYGAEIAPFQPFSQCSSRWPFTPHTRAAAAFQESSL